MASKPALQLALQAFARMGIAQDRMPERVQLVETTIDSGSVALRGFDRQCRMNVIDFGSETGNTGTELRISSAKGNSDQ